MSNEFERSLLSQFFSGYLKLSVFPVALEYEIEIDGTKRIYDPLQSHLALWQNSDVQRSLLNWAEIWRFPFFFRSLIFSEYRFCLKLAEKLEKDICYAQFKTFKERMSQSPAAYIQFELWLAIEGCKSYNNSKINMQKLSIARRRYQETIDSIGQTLPLYMNEAVCLKWCREIQDQIIGRLTSYWWPRMSNNHCSQHTMHNDTKCKDREGTNFLEVLQCNHLFAGDPFHDFLIKTGEESHVILYKLWIEINDLLVHRMEYADYEIQKKYMKIYAKYCTSPLIELAVLPKSSERELLLEKLFSLQDSVLEVLKRKWTSYQHDDYESLYSNFSEENRLEVDRNFQSKPNRELAQQPMMPLRPQSTRLRVRSSRIVLPKFDMKLSVTDLMKSPFEGIADMEFLDEFQQYLIEKCGHGSLQVSSYQLWLSVLLHQKMPPSAREHSAKKLHRKFFSKFAKSHSALQDACSGNSLIRTKGHANISHLFDELQLSAMENFSQQLLDFLKIKNDDESSASRCSVLSFSDITKTDGTKLCSSETVKELQAFMKTTSNLQSRKMVIDRAFEHYLTRSGTEQCPGLMVNSLNFWREVERFQALRSGSASGCFLLKKIEALIDNYLDADTPPWVKISMSAHTAREILDTFELLSTKSCEQENEAEQTIADMLVKAQKHIFIQLLEVWVEFNGNYRSEPPTPTHSSRTSSSHSTLKSSRRSLSPLSCSPTPIIKQKSILCYSLQEGLQWMKNSSN